MKIEVEADNLEQVRALVQMEGVDVILLDNMETAEMREAIALGRRHNVKFEASGGINLRTVRRIAATGVDYISVGALTHSPRAIDLSLELPHGCSCPFERGAIKRRARHLHDWPGAHRARANHLP